MKVNAVRGESLLWHSDLFGVVAPALGWVPPIRFLLRRARILRALEGLAPGQMVEVGCGAGALLHELATFNVSATGLETSARAQGVARAIAEHGAGKQQITDVPDQSWEANCDLVCSFDVMEHIEDDDAAIETWSRWLKPGGHLCLSVPAHRKRWGAGDEWAGHWRRYERQNLIDMLESHDLVIRHVECYGFPLANLTEWQGNRIYKKLLVERGISTKAEATGESGVERSQYLRLFNHMDTAIGRLGLRIALVLQSLTAATDWGSGYLILASKP